MTDKKQKKLMLSYEFPPYMGLYQKYNFQI